MSQRRRQSGSGTVLLFNLFAAVFNGAVYVTAGHWWANMFFAGMSTGVALLEAARWWAA